jgi:sporulation protein YlmC with PRC-barrel domain
VDRLDPGSEVRLGELLRAEVRTESGETLGSVFDLRGELTRQSLKVTGLVVGKAGLLERLGIGAPQSQDRIRVHDVVPWSAVVRFNRHEVIVRDGTKPQ